MSGDLPRLGSTIPGAEHNKMNGDRSMLAAHFDVDVWVRVDSRKVLGCDCLSPF
jgi:hypothetical protein